MSTTSAAPRAHNNNKKLKINSISFNQKTNYFDDHQNEIIGAKDSPSSENNHTKITMKKPDAQNPRIQAEQT